MTGEPPATENGLFIVPTAQAAGDLEVERDCKVANALLHKLMRDSPELSASEAYELIKRRITRVCVFQWHKMTLQSSGGNATE